MKPILKKIAASYIVLEIFALCVICAATLMSGCLETDDPAESPEQNMLNRTEVTKFAAELQQLTTDHMDAIDAARDDRDDSYDATFDQWDIKTDDLISTSGDKVDDLYIDYMGSSMTYDVYTARYDAIWNAHNRQFDMYDRERDREYESAHDLYSDVKDELVEEYDISVATLIGEIGGDNE